MADLDSRIAALKLEIQGHQADYDRETTPQTRSELRALITATSNTLTALIQLAQASTSKQKEVWTINPKPHQWMLGDTYSNPNIRSSSIIVGRKTVLACAHSIGTGLRSYYNGDYFLQLVPQSRSLSSSTLIRIPLKLYKFHLENDWALFVRADSSLFEEDEVAKIDMTALNDDEFPAPHSEGRVYHIPVSLLSSLHENKPISCNRVGVHIQACSSHRLKYEGRNFCRGSSGGGVYISPSTSVVGMHTEHISELELDFESPAPALSTKRVVSEEDSLPGPSNSSCRESKRLKAMSDTVASSSATNNGQGSAIIICKFPRLLFYLNEIETNL